MVVGEILLNAFFEVLFDRLASRDLLKFVRQLQGGVDSEIKMWEKKFKMIRAVLSDAEEKQLTDEAVKMWLDDLQDLAYDAEDILDEFATQALERKLMEEEYHPLQDSTGEVLNFIPAGFAGLNPSAIISNYSMGSKIKDITSRLEQLCKEKVQLGLQVQRIPGAGGASSTASQRRPPSSSVPTERVVYGREKDKGNILELILTDTPIDHANIVVIPIVGMAGVGKTTVARGIYNDKAIDDSKFDIKAWVCVSDDFDIFSISKALLESITGNPCLLNTLNEVQVQLTKAVDGQKILLVLDDVWNEDYGLWEDLKAPFLAAARNSKIIITTRHSHVASTMEPIQQYNLQRLSDEDCWSLFMMHAFVCRDMISAHQISDLFREKVVVKCGGLPLAAKVLGGLLRSKRHEAWDEILNNNILDLPQQNGILPVLRLSYHYLPSHLKRCFGYCAIFPKDYEFEKNELLLFWMAEGIVQQSRNDKQLEDLGSECFDELVSRSIFQESSSDSSKFLVHDLVHDLAQLVSGETNVSLGEIITHSRRLERVRHFCYTRGRFDGKNKFEIFYDVENLRTFLPVSKRGGTGVSYLTSMVIFDLLPRFKKMRVLSLAGYYITSLSISVEEWRHIKYLNLAGTKIRSLPESTNSLFCLLILILRDCSRLRNLPSKISNLVNLHHLDIKGANLLKEMPLGMKKLKNLRMLSNFIVGKGAKVSGLKDLKSLTFLSGELCISGLENLNDSRDARDGTLWEKHNLEALSLQWRSEFDNSRDMAAEDKVLDMLQPHKNIKELTIGHFGGARFSLWIADPSFTKMEVVKLENCANCTLLPSLGLLMSLKVLTIKGMKKLKTIGSEFYGEGGLQSFQSLETLCFEDLPEWEYWVTNVNGNGNVEIFPSLLEVSIVDCPKLLGKLPELLPTLEIFVVRKCAELVVSVSSFPMLRKLEIDGCKGLVCSTPVDSKLIDCMTISNSSLDICGCKGMIYYYCPADSKSQPNSVTISNILEFGNFLSQGYQQVETLLIRDLQQIKWWWHYGVTPFQTPVQGLHLLTYPEEIAIGENCISLVSLPMVKFQPNNLCSLKIEKCRAFKSLPEDLIGAQLERLYVSYCDSLTFVARRKLPSSLKRLQIWNCQNLQCLVDGEQDASSSSSSSSSSAMLKYLSIYNCPELSTLLSGTHFLEELEYLFISICPKLESVPDGLHNLNCLQQIYVWNCPSLVSFPERGLPNSISSLTIDGCLKLEALPHGMHKLNSLQSLYIRELPAIKSFPAEGFPTNLTSLTIEDVKMYKALIGWGLHWLTSLRHLYIDGCHDTECFPDEEVRMLLPTSIAELTICGFQKLKYLSSMGFQNLASLEYMWISNCPNLKSFPELGLPSSLWQLYITDCRLLKRECKNDKGKEWSKIAHIPCVWIDGKFIYDTEE